MSHVKETSLLIALPTSILSIEHGLALKSLRVHQVARWSSIFGVREVVFYRESTTSVAEFTEHQRLIRDHWSYFFTPPYLRRRLVPLTHSLRYVGMLPPIRLEVFNVDKKPRRGEIRVGYIYLDENGSLRALIGDNASYQVVNKCNTGLTPLRVLDPVERLVECVDIDVYMGPRLLFTNSLRETVELLTRRVDYLVATDREGELIRGEIVESMRGKRIGILFGSPRYGLYEISSQEGFNLEEYVDYTWNTIPNQRVASVRTEEALIITLGVVNVFLRGV